MKLTRAVVISTLVLCFSIGAAGQEAVSDNQAPFDLKANCSRLAEALGVSLTGSKLPNDRVAQFASTATIEIYRELVDELLASKDFAKRLADFWLTAINDPAELPEVEVLKRDWLRKQIANDTLLELLPTRAEESRVLALGSAINSIRKTYQDEIEKVVRSDAVETWYGTLQGMPIPEESSIVLDFDHRHPNVEAWRSRGGETAREGNRSSLRFDGTQPLSISLPQQEPRTSSFAFCIQLKLDTLSDSLIASNFDASPASPWQGYSISLDQGKLVFQLRSAMPLNSLSVQSSTQIPIQRWLHIAVVYRGTRNANDVKLYLNGESLPIEVLRDQMLLDENSEHSPSSSLVAIGGGEGSNPRFRGEIRRLQIYNVSLTSIEVASLATDKPMLPWEELSKAQQRSWQDHYIERIDQRCKYHLESLLHYNDTLSKITKDRFGMYLFLNNLKTLLSPETVDPKAETINGSRSAQFVCEKLWRFAIPRPVEWTSVPKEQREEWVQAFLASGGKQRAVLRKIVLSDYYLQSVLKLSGSSK